MSESETEGAAGEDLAARAAAGGVTVVRIAYCDNANLIRAKATPVAGLAAAVRFGLGFSVAQQAIPVMYDTVLPDSGLAPVGEVWLMPDPDTFTALPYSPGDAMMLGDFVEEDGTPWPHCPRTALKRGVAALAAEGLTLQAAFEPEFYLLRPGDGRHEPVDATRFGQTMAYDLAHVVLHDLLAALDRMGLEVHLVYPESGPGQFEVSIHHADPVGAADRQVLLREAVRGVAARHGLMASFAPKPFADQAGSGAHVHLSLWRGEKNALYDADDPLRLSRQGYAWTAGLLAHLPGLCALTIPSVNSYRRIRPRVWAGAYACYGLENREAAVRVITPRRGAASMNIELKTVDSSANPYLALAGILAAGLDGLRRGLHPGDPVEVNPAELPAEEREVRGIVELPGKLAEAIEALTGDPVLLEALGEPLARSFLAVRRGEWDAMGMLEADAEGQIHLFTY